MQKPNRTSLTLIEEKIWPEKRWIIEKIIETRNKRVGQIKWNKWVNFLPVIAFDVAR
jgi:hypothetical protein